MLLWKLFHDILAGWYFQTHIFWFFHFCFVYELWYFSVHNYCATLPRKWLPVMLNSGQNNECIITESARGGKILRRNTFGQQPQTKIDGRAAARPAANHVTQVSVRSCPAPLPLPACQPSPLRLCGRRCIQFLWQFSSEEKIFLEQKSTPPRRKRKWRNKIRMAKA